MHKISFLTGAVFNEILENRVNVREIILVIILLDELSKYCRTERSIVNE
jgi:hypothetical protein